jgi:hypothetical protein
MTLMNLQKNQTASLSALSWLLFGLSPVIALWVSLTDRRSKVARDITWAGCVFYGLMFNILPGQGSDCVRYAEELKQMHLTQTSWELLSSTFYQDGQTRFDIYQPTLTLIVSRFTGDYHILFALFGFVIGYFYSRTVWFFVDRLPQKAQLVNFLFILAVAFLLNPGSAINGVRMYTAFYIFLYGALKFFEKQQMAYLVLAGSSFLVHFSFAYPFAMMLAVPVAERFPGLALSALTASFLIPSVENTSVSDLLGFLPGFQQRVSSYLVNPEMRKEEVGWLLTLTKYGNIAFVMASAYMLPLILGKTENQVLRRIGMLAVLVYTGVNICWNVYSFGRFSGLSLLLFSGLWAIIPPNVSVLRLPYQLFGLSIFCFILPGVAIGIRLFLGFVSIGILLGNPFTFTWFYEADRSAYDFLLVKFRPW